MRPPVPYCLFKDKPQPWLRLFLRCEAKSDDFYIVEIYQTEKAMQRAIRRQDINSAGTGRMDTKCKACCFSYNAYDGKHRITSEKGTIFFHRKFITPAALAHEFTHAALAWARKRRMSLSKRTGRYSTDAEERVCHMVGYLMWQFYHLQKGRVYFVCGSDVQHRDVAKCFRGPKKLADALRDAA